MRTAWLKRRAESTTAMGVAARVSSDPPDGIPPRARLECRPNSSPASGDTAMKKLFAVAIFLSVVTAGAVALAQMDHGSHGGHGYYYPEKDEGVAALPARKAAQLAAASKIGVFHGFQFTDRQPESGITFRNEETDDSGREYKMVHYDHGN